MVKEHVDRLIIGAGLYGLYSAWICGKRGLRVVVMEIDSQPFGRATYVNQARVHMGYHYPRSISTAMKSAGYFRRFSEEFDFCIHNAFDQIYATSSEFSWTNASQFESFCEAAGIKCEPVSADKYFKRGSVDGAFLTEEYTYDAMLLKEYLIDKLSSLPNVTVLYGIQVNQIVRDNHSYQLFAQNSYGDDLVYETEFLLNVTYASVNQILQKVIPDELFEIKYELCEIILCEPAEILRNVGITVMDGPFFSIMPFGKTGLHSLTSVTFTPHKVCREAFPHFACQEQNPNCSINQLDNCNECEYHPESAWPYMSHLADKYLLDGYSYRYVKSLFSMKPILLSSEVDDSRPTAIRIHSGGPGTEEGEPTFISVLSGKINTVYDLNEYL